MRNLRELRQSFRQLFTPLGRSFYPLVGEDFNGIDIVRAVLRRTHCHAFMPGTAQMQGKSTPNVEYISAPVTQTRFGLESSYWVRNIIPFLNTLPTSYLRLPDPRGSIFQPYKWRGAVGVVKSGSPPKIHKNASRIFSALKMAFPGANASSPSVHDDLIDAGSHDDVALSAGCSLQPCGERDGVAECLKTLVPAAYSAQPASYAPYDSYHGHGHTQYPIRRGCGSVVGPNLDSYCLVRHIHQSCQREWCRSVSFLPWVWVGSLTCEASLCRSMTAIT